MCFFCLTGAAAVRADAFPHQFVSSLLCPPNYQSLASPSKPVAVVATAQQPPQLQLQLPASSTQVGIPLQVFLFLFVNFLYQEGPAILRFVLCFFQFNNGNTQLVFFYRARYFMAFSLNVNDFAILIAVRALCCQVLEYELLFGNVLNTFFMVPSSLFFKIE